MDVLPALGHLRVGSRGERHPGDVHLGTGERRRADRHLQRSRRRQRRWRRRGDDDQPRRAATGIRLHGLVQDRVDARAQGGRRRRRSARSASGRPSGASPRAARWTTRAWPRSCAAAVEDGDKTVGIKQLKDGDRAVWRAALTMDGKQIDVVVDQQTGIVTWYSDGHDTFTAQVDWASPPPADSTYAVDVPAGTGVKTIEADAYTYVATPAAAGRVAGYSPLVSGPRAGRLHREGGRDGPRRVPAAGLARARGRRPSAHRPGPSRGRRRRAVCTGPQLVHRGADRPQDDPLLRHRPPGLAGVVGRAGCRCSRPRCSTERSRARRPTPGTRSPGRRSS